MGPVRCPCWQLVDRSFDVRILGSGARRAIGRSPHAASRAASISRPGIRWVPYRLALRRTARAPLQPNPRPWCFIGRWTPRPPPTRPLPPTRPSPRASRPTSTGRSRRSCGARPTGCSRSRCAVLGDRRDAEEAGPGRARPGLPGARTATTPARIRELRLAAVADDDRRERLPQPDPGPPGSGRPSWASSPARSRPTTRSRGATTATRGRACWRPCRPAQRIAIVLRHVDGLSYAEMAEALGKPEGTLKAQVHRGLAAAPRRPRRRGPRARGDDRMTRLDPNPTAASGGTPGSRRSRPPSRRSPSPRPPRLGHATLVAVGLADDYAVIDSPDRAAPGRLERPGRLGGRRGAATTARSSRASSRGPAAGASACASLPPRLARAVERRLAGDRRARIDLDLRGSTEFEQAVWLKALEIPRGEVRPYGWIAAEIGRPKAVRAVGTALGHNPIPLIVPCHRVVRTRRHDRPVLARRAGQQADDPRRGGRRPGRARGAGAGRHPLRRLGHDPDLLPADLPRRPAGDRSPPGPASRRRGRRTTPATGPASTAGRSRPSGAA